MAIITKKIDMGTHPYGWSASWDSSAADFAEGDTLDIKTSFNRPSMNVTVDVAAGASCTIRVNSMNRRYPRYDRSKYLPQPINIPDLANEEIWWSSDAPQYIIGPGETLELGSDYPVATIEIVAISGDVVIEAR